MVVKLTGFFILIIVALISILNTSQLPINVKPFVVLSGSMRPKIFEGSIVFVSRNFKNYEKGDIITFKNPIRPTENITHRIVSISNKDNRLIFNTQGDANGSQDNWTIYKESIFGRVIFTVPFLGYIVNFAKTKIGTVLLIVLPLLIITFFEILTLIKEIKKKYINKTVLPIFIFLYILIYQSSITFSFFNNSVIATDNIIQTGFWVFPETSILNQQSVENKSNITINYSVQNGENLDYVQLCYSYNLDYYNCPETEEFRDLAGSFNFIADKNGLYTFYTIAINANGYQENLDNLEDKLYMVNIDTTPPTTNIDLTNFNQPIWSGQNLITNGSFENNFNSWQVGDSNVDNNIVETGIGLDNETIFPQSGSKMLYVSDVYQELIIPQNISSNLTFWYRFLSSDTVDYDHFVSQIKSTDDSVIENVLITGSNETNNTDSWIGDSGWRQVFYPLNNFAGKNIKLRFKVINEDNQSNPLISWAYIDNIKINSLDPRTNQDSTIDFETHDNGTGLLNIPEETNVFIGENTINFSSTDISDNTEATHSANIVVMPKIVLNKIAFNSSDKWIEIFNNTDSNIDINNWKIKNKIGQTLPITNTNISASSPSIIYHQDNPNFYFNNSSDTISLVDSINQVVDTTTYYSQQIENEIWQRTPDGIGTWDLINTDILDLNLIYRPDVSKITFSIFNINTNILPFDYEILYSSKNEVKNIFGTINSLQDNENKVDRDFYLGTCSSNVCTSDLDVGSTFQVILSSDNLNFNRYFHKKTQ